MSSSTASLAEGQRLVDLLGEASRPRLAGRLLGRMVGAGRGGELLARVLRGPLRAQHATTAVTGAHARLLRASGGRVRRSWLFAAGQPVMVLTTLGRRSGKPQTTPVTAFACEDKLAAAGMNLGLERRPGWAYNLEANGEARVMLSGRNLAVRARLSHGAERERLWRRWSELQPSAEAFARLAGREIPIFVFEPRTGPADEPVSAWHPQPDEHQSRL